MKQTRTHTSNWYDVAHQILAACRPLADRVVAEGVKLMLTDTDWTILEGFELVNQQSNQAELLPLCVAAGLNRRQYAAMLDLYNFKKRR